MFPSQDCRYPSLSQSLSDGDSGWESFGIQVSVQSCYSTTLMPAQQR